MDRRLIIPCLAAAVFCASGAAHADPPKAGAAKGSPNAPDRADQLFEDGATAFDAGRFAEARAKLAEAWGLKKTYDIAGNLGVVEVRLSMFPEAAEHLSWALLHFPPTETVKARRGYEQELEKARAQTGALQIRVSVDGADVVVNGRPVGAALLGDTVFVAPGVIKVAARRDGYVGAEQTVTVGKGEARSITLALVPAVPERRSIVPGVVLGGVAGIGVAVGAGVLAAAGSKRTTADGLGKAVLAAHNSCVTGAANFDARCADIRSDTSTSDNLHDAGVGVLIGAGTLAAATAAYFIWPATRVSVVPIAGKSGAGLWLSGSF
jgi:hypothetical protein